MIILFEFKFNQGMNLVRNAVDFLFGKKGGVLYRSASSGTCEYKLTLIYDVSIINMTGSLM